MHNKQKEIHELLALLLIASRMSFFKEGLTASTVRHVIESIRVEHPAAASILTIPTLHVSRTILARFNEAEALPYGFVVGERQPISRAAYVTHFSLSSLGEQKAREVLEDLPEVCRIALENSLVSVYHEQGQWHGVSRRSR